MGSNYLLRTPGPIEAVIFDLDDTLISWAQQSLPWNEYLAPMMVRVVGFLQEQGYAVDSAEAFGQRFGRNTRVAWRQAIDDGSSRAVSLSAVLRQTLDEFAIDGVDLERVMRAFDWQPMPGVQPYQDAHEVLDRLRDDGIKIGLITNAFQPMWMRDVELEAYGLTERLDARITSGDTGFMKPHPAIYWRMLGMLGTTPDRAVFVGDSPHHDIRGANSVGMVTVWIDPPHLDKQIETEEDRPNYTVERLSQLPPIVAELNRRADEQRPTEVRDGV